MTYTEGAEECVCWPMKQCPSLPLQYQIFIPMVNKVMLKHRVNHQRYDILICRIVKVGPSEPASSVSLLFDFTLFLSC